jgi:hypothetical protein
MVLLVLQLHILREFFSALVQSGFCCFYYSIVSARQLVGLRLDKTLAMLFKLIQRKTNGIKPNSWGEVKHIVL